MTAPVLYSFRRCPFAMRSRMALDAAAVSFEHREILLRNKPRQMIEASPKGTVPVLVLNNGEVIDESLDIMRWALDYHDPENWRQSNQATQEFIALCDGPFKHHLDRYKYASRYAQEDSLYHREHAQKILQLFDIQIQKHGFLAGTQPNIADVATFPFIRQFSIADPSYFHQLELPALQKWLTFWLESTRFQRIMKKHPIFQESPS